MPVPSDDSRPAGGVLIRIGGVSVLAALAIHIVLNGFLKEFPPADPTAAELREYLAREASTWAVVHGFRYLAFAGVVLFAAGLFSRVVLRNAAAAAGWGVVGLLGTAIWVTNGIVTNGIEIVAFLDHDVVGERQELFWLLFRLTRVLFTAEVAAWSITILGFCVAGWRSATLPRWLSVLGLFCAAAGLLGGVFIASILDEGRAIVLIDIAAPASLLWFLCTGVYMAVRGGTLARAPGQGGGSGSRAMTELRITP